MDQEKRVARGIIGVRLKKLRSKTACQRLDLNLCPAFSHRNFFNLTPSPSFYLKSSSSTSKTRVAAAGMVGGRPPTP